MQLSRAVQNMGKIVQNYLKARCRRGVDSQEQMAVVDSWSTVLEALEPALVKEPEPPTSEPEAPEAPDPEKGASERVDEADGDDAEKT